MYIINPDASISIARGDTMQFAIKIFESDGETPAKIPAGAVAVFAVSSLAAGSNARTASAVRTISTLRAIAAAPIASANTILEKVFPVDDGDTVVVRLTNADTRVLTVGTYQWDARIVTDPEYDGQGHVKCDDTSDEVISIFSGEYEMPKFIVTEVAANV